MIEHSFKAMGGPCRLRLDTQSSELAGIAIERVLAELDRLESKYSRYLPDSLTTRINAAAGKEMPVAIDRETAGLLQYADTLYRESSGLFDLTSGVLRRAWNFTGDSAPSTAELESLLPLVAWPEVDWNQEHVALPRAGMELDFGGVVKEYACDAAAGVLAALGLDHALVDLAGDLAVTGPRADGSPWPVGIRHPRYAGQAAAELHMVAGGLASSGDYERCLVIDGERYGHILHPRTGWPVRGLLAVSITSPQCLVAGSLATVAMLKPAREATAWLDSLGVTWFAVDAELRCHRGPAAAAGVERSGQA